MSDDQRSEEKSEKPRIKVTDRRKFTATGEVRPATDEPAPESVPPEEPAPESVPDEEPAPHSPAAEAPVPPEGVRDGEPSGAPGPLDIDALPRDFTAFIEGMYLETMLYLGAMPDPRSGEPAEDLDMAKYKIDLLGMLQEKTRGNLTDEEGQQLEEVLYQLRMFYVQTRKKAGG